MSMYYHAFMYLRLVGLMMFQLLWQHGQINRGSEKMSARLGESTRTSFITSLDELQIPGIGGQMLVGQCGGRGRPPYG